MSRKGVYPYDFMDSFEKFDQTELPAKEHFYSILNDQDITDNEYDHAKTVWKAFKIKTMGEYHDLYLGSEVLLLADVFESFRKTCLQYYKLDPCHYFTSPGLLWDAMTNIELELMTFEKETIDSKTGNLNLTCESVFYASARKWHLEFPFKEGSQVVS